MRKVPAGGAGTAARTGLLPFLDIVFGTIGVFVVVFALQHVIGNNEGAPAGVDAIVVCVDGDRLAAHWPDRESGPVEPPRRSLDLLRAMAASERPFRSLILAIGPGCFEARGTFMKGYERFLDASANPAFPGDRPRADLMLELYPVGGAAGAAALLERWRGDREP